MTIKLMVRHGLRPRCYDEGGNICLEMTKMAGQIIELERQAFLSYYDYRQTSIYRRRYFWKKEWLISPSGYSNEEEI